ncbi:MAG: RNA polymerase sigma factor [Clostridia bacterium]|nr:RNA polymerase sigma factor [Clostridia bacterium]
MGSLIGDFISDNFNKLKRHLQYSFDELSEADAEDIIQATAVKLLGGRAGSVDFVSSYVYRSVTNGAKDFFRKSNRIVLTDKVETGETRNAEDDVLNGELGEQIKAALYTLDAKSRHVFMETEIKGRSYQELSEETGEPIGTLLSRKSRATRKLRILLKDYVDDGGIS